MTSETNSKRLPALQEFSVSLRQKLNLVPPVGIRVNFPEVAPGSRVLHCSHPVLDAIGVSFQGEGLQTTCSAGTCVRIFG